MEFRLLGPFDVLVDGRTAQLGGSKQRALLAILTIHANEVVPTERLRKPCDLQGFRVFP